MLSGCRTYSPLKHIKGKYRYEDTIYLKCTGSTINEQCPTGWIRLDDEKKYSFQAVYSFRATFLFEDTDKVLGLRNEVFLNASLKLSAKGITMKTVNDYTDTFEAGTTFTLERTFD